jgi:Protein of unknown function (DUF4058)
MPSPFPGMDPYLEAHWRDVHASLIVYASDTLQSALPRSLRARINERLMQETPENIARHPCYPDVWVVEYAARRGLGTRPEGWVPPAEPLLVEVDPEPVTESFLEIIDLASRNRVVTVLEFLSPSNKSPGPNREHYLRKQGDLCSSVSNLVEIDLNRFGIHTLAFPLDHIKPQVRTPYMACIRRTTRRDKAEVYPMLLWERLPILEIPLRPEDADVKLDLQALVDQCYRNGGYEGTLDYTADPEPPLSSGDKTWADERLREIGLRKKTRGKDKGQAKKK